MNKTEKKIDKLIKQLIKATKENTIKWNFFDHHLAKLHLKSGNIDLDIDIDRHREFHSLSINKYALNPCVESLCHLNELALLILETDIDEKKYINDAIDQIMKELNEMIEEGK